MTGCIAGCIRYQDGCTACAQFQAIHISIQVPPDVRSVTAKWVNSHYKKQLRSTLYFRGVEVESLNAPVLYTFKSLLAQALSRWVNAVGAGVSGSVTVEDVRAYALIAYPPLLPADNTTVSHMSLSAVVLLPTNNFAYGDLASRFLGDWLQETNSQGFQQAFNRAVQGLEATCTGQGGAVGLPAESKLGRVYDPRATACRVDERDA